MRAKIAVVITTAAALALPAAAASKEIEHVNACGAAGCDDVTSIAAPAALDGGGRANPPGAAAPFFRIEVKVRAGDAHDGWSFLYVPSAQKVQGDDGTWMNPTTASLRALDRLVKGLEPLPADRLALPSTPGEAPAPPPPAAADSGGGSAAAWAFGLAGAGALLVSGLILVLRRRGPRPA
jgi:hypothetical protein